MTMMMIHVIEWIHKWHKNSSQLINNTFEIQHTETCECVCLNYFFPPFFKNLITVSDYYQYTHWHTFTSIRVSFCLFVLLVFQYEYFVLRFFFCCIIFLVYWANSITNKAINSYHKKLQCFLNTCVWVCEFLLQKWGYWIQFCIHSNTTPPH